MGHEITLQVPARVADPNLNFKGQDHAAMQTLTLNRGKCLKRELVDSFFRVSRHNSDDVIQQKLNDTNGPKNDQSKTTRCRQFVEQELYRGWDLRLKALNFCEQEAADLKQELDGKMEAEIRTEKSPVLTARMDPYAAAEDLELRQARYEQWRQLTKWISNQRAVEDILQKNAAKVLTRACDPDTAYIDDFKKFRASMR
ncbi:LADA_0H06766g1_1 [Lachancea dasiensis]|uniref:LADA_0H06766g1_1 n=1 Tax=Lachancea dasiensis TaxID=1072105 RepID=A0A1G4K1R2_9SACH|nr:LADA_0H06766g1_1 [Lachancea dasiensis]